jgi:hypothetical protein
MPEDEQQQQDAFRKLVRHYADMLNPLFDTTLHNERDWLFEFVRVLMRESGMKDAGWDAFQESRAVLDDLSKLARLELSPESFPDAERTRARLWLMSYCRLTEMDFPYTLIANLLRMKLRQKYRMDPFADLATPLGADCFDIGRPTRQWAATLLRYHVLNSQWVKLGSRILEVLQAGQRGTSL